MNLADRLFGKARETLLRLHEDAESGLAAFAFVLGESVHRFAPRAEDSMDTWPPPPPPPVERNETGKFAASPAGFSDTILLNEVQFAQNRQPTHFAVGSVVNVWSNSQGKWFHDGIIKTITQAQNEPTCDRIQVGAVMVVYSGETKTKWVVPDDFGKIIEEARPFDQPVAQGDQQEFAAPDDRSTELQALQLACKQKNKPFLDWSFPPRRTGCATKWCRPNEIGWHDGHALWHQNWQLFRGPPHAEDVQQGELGDCWFLSSLSATAEFQGGRLVQRLLPGQSKACAFGAYLVRLCLGGLWRDVIVDDRFPCSGGMVTYTQLAYCSTQKCQLWASLVEKGFAKVCGSYEALASGQTEEALTMLTGWPCTTIQFDREDFDSDTLWAKLSTSRSAGFLMTCSISTGQSGSETACESVGLVPKHAYCLIDVFDIDINFGGGGKSVRLLKIRNPHAKETWKGAWSDCSLNWTPELRRHLGSSEATKAGMFFMAYEDFLYWFESCTICKVRSDGWHKLRMATQLPGGTQVPMQGWVLNVSETTECSLCITQPELRTREGPIFADLKLGDLACIGLVLVSAEGPPGFETMVVHALAHPRCQAVVSTECWLKPGCSYFLIPLSAHPGTALPAVCSIFSSQPVTCKPKLFSKNSVHASWVAFARFRGSVSDQFHGARIFTAKTSGGGMVVSFAENRGRGYFRADLKIEHLEGDPLTFSRGAAATSDWLAPGQAQLLQVLVPTYISGSTWRSIQSFKMQSLKPAEPSHIPDLGSDLTGLHRPFHLRLRGQAAYDTSHRERNNDRGTGWFWW